MNKFSGGLFAALLALGCISEALADAGAPFLWTIKGDKTTHYLLGSVHMLPASSQPLPPGLDAAYAKAGAVVFETDLAALSDPQTQLGMLSAANAPKGIKQLIGPTLYQKLVQRAATMEMPLDATCEQYKPWFCAMTLEVFSYERAGFQPQYGLDQVFYNRANNDGKTIGWLEEPTAHLALFTQMPDTLSTQFLSATLDELTESGQNPAEMLRMWREGDLASLEKATLEMKSKHPQAYSRLLADRSRAWVSRLKILLSTATSQLIVVGAAHNVGPDGLPSLLRKAGFEVQPVIAEPVVAPVTSPVAESAKEPGKVETAPLEANPQSLPKASGKF